MIKNLISLRGIFILFIFLHHTGVYPGGGTMAVSFFFVLGGFSMTLGYKDRLLRGNFDYRQYITRRCIKFYPLHWLCLMASVLLLIVYNSLSLKDIPILILNASLLHTWIPDQNYYFSFNAVSWYLADTMFFATLFPFILKYIINGPVKKVVLYGSILFSAVYVAIVIFVPSYWYHAVLYISPFVRVSDFIFGIVLALFYLNIRQDNKLIKIEKSSVFWVSILPGLLIILLVVESCVLPKNIGLIAPLYWPIVALLIILVSLTDKRVNWIQRKAFLKLGEISFTVFLVHYMVLEYSSIAFRLLHLDKDYLYILITFVLTIVLSLLLERYILVPIAKWSTERNLQSMTAHS